MDQLIDAEFYEKYGVRTDLAIEAQEVIVEKEGPPEIPGVIVNNEETEFAKLSRVSIESDVGQRIMGKMKGHYVTVEVPSLRERNKDAHGEVSKLIANEITNFMAALDPEDPVLVIGLGNWNATPDALGPRAVGSLLVSRHLYEMSPPELRGGMRPVAAVSPGVLGLTGIETGEIVKGIVDKIKPKMVFCIDALASRSTKRLCSTIQLADTGISPGAGVGNKRMGINQETLGVPVIAVGVPTVVHASTIVSDGMELLNSGGNTENVELPDEEEVGLKKTNFNLGAMNIMGNQRQTQTQTRQVDPAQKRQVINQILQPFLGSMIVTPKEIDVLIDDVAKVIAGGMNAAFHPSLSPEEIDKYVH